MLATLKNILRPYINRYRSAQKRRRRHLAIQQQIQQVVAAGDMLRLVVGAGETDYPGWVKTDVPYLDVLKVEDWARLTPPKTIDRLLAEHVFEHLTTDEFCIFLRNARPYLKSDGFIRIAVPDGNHPDPEYIEHVRPGGTGVGADDHKVLYTYDLITDLLKAEGYAYRLLEYFDEQGEFHKVDWDVADGMIMRSADHDNRNKETPLVYTSLIVDIWVK